MIKIEKSSTQVISKDDFVLNGQYSNTFSLFGIKLYKKMQVIDNDVQDRNAKPSSSAGFKN